MEEIREMYYPSTNYFCFKKISLKKFHVKLYKCIVNRFCNVYFYNQLFVNIFL
jgi:hypothetical protein